MDEHLTEEQLLQLALSVESPEGQGGDATGARHLAACSVCAARLVALRDELTESLLGSTADTPPATPALLDSAHGLKVQVLQAAALSTMVLNAVALAGGFTYRAKQNDFLLQRGGSNAEAVTVGIDTPILPGDIVTVQERFF